MTAASGEGILQRVEAYYTGKVEAHGATPAGVDWNGATSHTLRHQQFMRLIETSPEAGIVDLGCGYGDFLTFLRTNGHRGPYAGYDISAAMIDHARRVHAQAAHCAWHVGAVPTDPLDFAVASGIFNVKGTVPAHDWVAYVRETIDVLARAGRQGFAFNMLSLASDPERRRADLHYADPAETLAYCMARFGRSVALLQDYGLYEFTMIVRRAA